MTKWRREGPRVGRGGPAGASREVGDQSRRRSLRELSEGIDSAWRYRYGGSRMQLALAFRSGQLDETGGEMGREVQEISGRSKREWRRGYEQKVPPVNRLFRALHAADDSEVDTRCGCGGWLVRVPSSLRMDAVEAHGRLAGVKWCGVRTKRQTGCLAFCSTAGTGRPVTSPVHRPGRSPDLSFSSVSPSKGLVASALREPASAR